MLLGRRQFRLLEVMAFTTLFCLLLGGIVQGGKLPFVASACVIGMGSLVGMGVFVLTGLRRHLLMGAMLGVLMVILLALIVVFVIT